MTTAPLPIIIIGAGGHGRVLADLCKSLKRPPLGFVDNTAYPTGHTIDQVPVLGTDEGLRAMLWGPVQLLLGIGSIRASDQRQRLYHQFVAWGYDFATAIHPHSIVSVSARVANGAQIMAGAIVQTGAQIGTNVIINTGAIIDHDCVIGAHSHIAPGAVLSGQVSVGENVLIGTGARVIQGIKIGSGALIAAGAVVTRDVPAQQKVAGVPATPMKGES